MLRAVALLLVLAPLVPAANRGVLPEDYFSYEFLSDAHLAPHGNQVAYVVTTIDQKLNRRRSTIYMTTVDGGTPRAMTAAAYSSNAPRWSPDGKVLAFLSNRGAAGAPAQLWLMSMAGGEPRQLTTLQHGVSSYQWAPDGTRIVAVGRSGARDSVAATDRRSDVRHYSTISYKFNDSGWFDDTRQHLWVIDVASGKDHQITSGQDWNDTDPQWSPDSQRIAFVSDRTGRAYEESRNTDVWVIPAAGGELVRISNHPFADNSPRWSPDGAAIAFLGEERERQHPKIYIAPSAGGAARMVAGDLDLIPTELTWAGKDALYFTAGVRGESHIFRVDMVQNRVAAVTKGPRAVHGFDIQNSSGRMVFAANDFEHPDDLYASNREGAAETKLTHLNSTLWSHLNLAKVERVTYKSADGLPVDGFLVKPVNFDAARKYPLIVSIHGGPAGQYGVDWYQEFQVYAAHGFGVFFCNPRGSTGYGEKFERGIVHNWGRNDYADVMAGLDFVLSRNPWIDSARLGVTGGSYGGYLTNWIVGHTDRFRAAVTLRSVSNFISDDGTRDGAYGHKDDFEGDIFQHFDEYWSASPLKYAASVHTPTLILHSDNDFRVPLEQGEQWFRALKHFGVTTELVIFPRENHNLTRTGEPKHLVESMNWQLYWFDRFLLNQSDARPPDQEATLPLHAAQTDR